VFDYRYHALSLAAVLFALAIGVLIGVVIGDSNLVSSARDGIVQHLRSEVKDSQRNLEQLSTQLSERQAAVEGLYPLAVHGRLAERNIGLVFLGGSSDRIDQLVRDAVLEAGGNVKTVVAVREPLDTKGIASLATGTRYTALSSEPSLVRQFGVRIGRQLVGGGQLLERVGTRLLSSNDGELGKLDGLAIARGDPPGMNPQAAKATGEFESGLIAGVATEQVPAIGVELGSSEPSQVPWYKHEGLSSVDDLETFAGRAALALALAGARGSFGVKPTADALLPSALSLSAQP
jgi:hypothetical protein